MPNLFDDVPDSCVDELVSVLASSTGVRVERIVSTGHCSPDDFWYDQAEHEWVVVLQGCGTIRFDDGELVELAVGDHLLIPARRKHRVEATSDTEPTIWLAVFFDERAG